MGIVPFFKRGDIGGLTYLVTNNIVNYLIVIATLSGVLKWPDKVVFGYVIPGMSIGLFLGCCYYAWMGYRISKKDQRPDVTALPSGVSTTAMFVMLYGVIMPLSYAVEDPMVAWSAAMGGLLPGRCDRVHRRYCGTVDEETDSESCSAGYGCGHWLHLDGNGRCVRYFR